MHGEGDVENTWDVSFERELGGWFSEEMRVRRSLVAKRRVVVCAMGATLKIFAHREL